jgi:hypothetical protein
VEKKDETSQDKQPGNGPGENLTALLRGKRLTSADR